MLDILRDPIWQFVGAVLAFAAVLAALASIRRQSNLKELSFDVRTKTRLLSTSEELAAHVAITYDGKPVKDIDLVEFAIANTGHVPISHGDFQDVIAVRFGEQASVLTCDVMRELPATLNARVELAGNEVRVQPLLMNPRDSFLVKVLVSSAGDTVSAHGRIVGASEIRKLEDRAPANRTEVVIAIIAAASFLANELTEYAKPAGAPSNAWLTMIVGIAFVALFWRFIFVAKRRARYNRWRWGTDRYPP